MNMLIRCLKSTKKTALCGESFLLYKFDSKTIQMKRIYIPLLYFVLVNLAILARGRIFGFLDYDKEIICTLIVYMSSKNLKKNLKVQCNE